MVDAAFPPDAAHIKIFERATSLRCVEEAITKARIRLMVGARVLAGAGVLLLSGMLKSRIGVLIIIVLVIPLLHTTHT